MTNGELQYMTVVQTALRDIARTIKKAEMPIIEFKAHDGFVHTERFCSLAADSDFGSIGKFTVNGISVTKETYDRVRESIGSVINCMEV